MSNISFNAGNANLQHLMNLHDQMGAEDRLRGTPTKTLYIERNAQSTGSNVGWFQANSYADAKASVHGVVARIVGDKAAAGIMKKILKNNPRTNCWLPNKTAMSKHQLAEVIDETLKAMPIEKRVDLNIAMRNEEEQFSNEEVHSIEKFYAGRNFTETAISNILLNKAVETKNVENPLGTLEALHQAMKPDDHLRQSGDFLYATPSHPESGKPGWFQFNRARKWGLRERSKKIDGAKATVQTLLRNHFGKEGSELVGQIMKPYMNNSHALSKEDFGRILNAARGWRQLQSELKLGLRSGGLPPSEPGDFAAFVKNPGRWSKAFSGFCAIHGKKRDWNELRALVKIQQDLTGTPRFGPVLAAGDLARKLLSRPDIQGDLRKHLTYLSDVDATFDRDTTQSLLKKYIASKQNGLLPTYKMFHSQHIVPAFDGFETDNLKCDQSFRDQVANINAQIEQQNKTGYPVSAKEWFTIKEQITKAKQELSEEPSSQAQKFLDKAKTLTNQAVRAQKILQQIDNSRIGPKERQDILQTVEVARACIMDNLPISAEKHIKFATNLATKAVEKAQLAQKK